MSSASDKSGKPDPKTGSGGTGAPSRKNGAAKTGSDGTAEAGAAPGNESAPSKTAAKSAAKSGAKAAPKPKSAVTPSAKSTTPAGSGAAPNAGTPPKATGIGDESGAAGQGMDAPVTPPKPAESSASSPGPKGSGGKGGSGDSGPPSADGGALFPWGRFGLYAAAGAVGGLIVALVFVLSGSPQDLQRRMDALQSKVENLGVAAGDPEQVAAMRRRLDALDGKVDSLADLKRVREELVRLDTKLAQLGGEVSQAETRLAARLESLEAVTPKDLPRQLDQAADKKTVNQLVARVATLEQDQLSRDVRRAALALALANLTRAVQTSQPFVNELKAIGALEPGNELVSKLEPHAQSGLPSEPTLAGRFDRVANDVVKAYRKAHDKGFFAGLWDRIKGLFRVRPVGEAEGAQAPAIVARAEQRLAGGDLYLATQELSKLGEPEKKAAAEWLGAAESRLRLNELVSQLNRQVLEEIAAAEAMQKARKERVVPLADEAPDSQSATPPEPRGAAEPAPEAAPAPEPDGGEENAPPSDADNEAAPRASER